MNSASTFSKSVLRRFFAAAIAPAILFGIGLAPVPLRAQQQGPIGPPPASSDSSGSPVMINHGSAIPMGRPRGDTPAGITRQPPPPPAAQNIPKISPDQTELRQK